jgi:hypothetical protein
MTRANGMQRIRGYIGGPINPTYKVVTKQKQNENIEPTDTTYQAPPALQSLITGQSRLLCANFARFTPKALPPTQYSTYIHHRLEGLK